MEGLGFVEGHTNPTDPSSLDRPFGPERDVSRAEFVTIVARILGLNPPNHAYAILSPLPAAEAQALLKTRYADTVPAWAAPYVAAMTKAGYVDGIDGMFDGNSPITRIEAGVIVSRLLKATGYVTQPANLNQFKDAANIPAWAKSGVVAGVLNGSNGKLNPDNPISRTEATVVLLRLFRDLGF
jgi:hypothetical protein